jgi:hypothetical protein
VKSLKQYLPESFLVELGEAPAETNSPISGAQVEHQPNPALTKNGMRELNVGDPIKVKSGRTQGAGETGTIEDFGQNKHFIIVKFNSDGSKHSYHESDIEFDDSAEDEDDEIPDRELHNLRRLSGIE